MDEVAENVVGGGVTHVRAGEATFRGAELSADHARVESAVPQPGGTAKGYPAPWRAGQVRTAIGSHHRRATQHAAEAGTTRPPFRNCFRHTRAGAPSRRACSLECMQNSRRRGRNRTVPQSALDLRRIRTSPCPLWQGDRQTSNVTGQHRTLGAMLPDDPWLGPGRTT